MGEGQKETTPIPPEASTTEGARGKEEGERMSDQSISMPMFIFVDDAFACQCTRTDAPLFVASYRKVFKNAKVEALTALEAQRKGKSLPKSRATSALMPEPEEKENKA
jgi:hypothetical protein